MKRKKTSRPAALAMALLTAVMAFLTAAMPAMAAGPGKITISPNGQPLEPGDRFEAYQIFRGDIGSREGELDNLEWGSGVDHERLIAAMKESKLPLGDGGLFGPTFSLAYLAWSAAHENETGEAEFAAQWLSTNVAGMPELADDFARLVAGCRTGEKSESNPWGGNWVIDGLPAGYYLVVDTYTTHGDTNKENGDSSVSSYILGVLGDVEVELKATIPTVEKKVEGQDGWLADTEEDVHFTIAGSIAENIGEYETYFYEFTDTLSRGLSMETGDIGSLQVKLYMAPDPDGKYDQSEGLLFEKWVDYQVELTELEDGASVLKVTFNDLKAAIEKHLVDGWLTDPASLKDIAGIRIVVFYTARLNGDAAVGSDGNPNHVVLDYSNNPYSDGKGESVPDEVKTYTLALKIQKNDEKGKPMEGVRFILENASNQYAVLEFVPLESSLDAGTGAASTRGPYWVITGWTDSPDEATELVTDITGTFSIHGLELGRYTLIETATKEGYEIMESVTFTIESADPDGIEIDGSLHTQIQIDQDTLSEGREDVTWDEQYLSMSGAQLTLRNFPSPILPHTGGTGAAVIYAVSGLAVLAGVCAVVFAVRKKGNRS